MRKLFVSISFLSLFPSFSCFEQVKQTCVFITNRLSFKITAVTLPPLSISRTYLSDGQSGMVPKVPVLERIDCTTGQKTSKTIKFGGKFKE